MIPPAPQDFWKLVIDRFAELIWERERNTGSAPQRGLPLRSVSSAPDSAGGGTQDGAA